MAVVLGGLGQPEESPLVTGGLGQAGTAPPGAMRATLAGSGALSGVLTGGDAPAPQEPARPPWLSPAVVPTLPAWLAPAPEPARPGWIAARLSGSSALSSDATFRIDPDALVAELASALLLDLV